MHDLYDLLLVKTYCSIEIGYTWYPHGYFGDMMVMRSYAWETLLGFPAPLGTRLSTAGASKTTSQHTTGLGHVKPSADAGAL